MLVLGMERQILRRHLRHHRLDPHHRRHRHH